MSLCSLKSIAIFTPFAVLESLQLSERTECKSRSTAEATGDLIRSKIADKITRSSKISRQDNLETNEEILREKFKSSELRQQIIADLRLKEN